MTDHDKNANVAQSDTTKTTHSYNEHINRKHVETKQHVSPFDWNNSTDANTTLDYGTNGWKQQDGKTKQGGKAQHYEEHINRKHVVTHQHTNALGLHTTDVTTTLDYGNNGWQEENSQQTVTTPAKTAKKRMGAVKHHNASHVKAGGEGGELVRGLTDEVAITSRATGQNPDFDLNADARVDASRLVQSVDRLKQALSNGLPGAASLRIFGAENLDQLSVLIQKDYAGIKESAIDLRYGDHLDAAFNQSLGSVAITHDNVEKLATAFDKAADNVRGLTKVAGGKTVSQDEVSANVRTTLKRELAETLTH